MDEISSLALGAAIGFTLAISYKIYSTINDVLEGAGSIIKYIKGDSEKDITINNNK